MLNTIGEIVKYTLYLLIESLLNVCHPLKVVCSFRTIDWCKSDLLFLYFFCLILFIQCHGFTHCILYCLLRSSKLLTGVSSLDTVRKAAKLAVYEAMMMKPKSHHVAATSRPDRFFGASPPPWGVSEVMQNQRASFRLKYLFSSSSWNKT